MDKLVSGNWGRSHARQMLCFLLAVDQPYAVFSTKSNEGGKRYLGGIGAPSKHGLPKHHAPKVDQIKSTGEFAINPGLN
jgi:hypothetical protein